jgi:hypothetical protein
MCLLCLVVGCTSLSLRWVNKDYWVCFFLHNLEQQRQACLLPAVSKDAIQFVQQLRDTCPSVVTVADISIHAITFINLGE